MILNYGSCCDVVVDLGAISIYCFMVGIGVADFLVFCFEDVVTNTFFRSE